jgi:hypothetical protein
MDGMLRNPHQLTQARNLLSNKVLLIVGEGHLERLVQLVLGAAGTAPGMD